MIVTDDSDKSGLISESHWRDTTANKGSVSKKEKQKREKEKEKEEKDE